MKLFSLIWFWLFPKDDLKEYLKEKKNVDHLKIDWKNKNEFKILPPIRQYEADHPFHPGCKCIINKESDPYPIDFAETKKLFKIKEYQSN
jgi:hypothetical protein